MWEQNVVWDMLLFLSLLSLLNHRNAGKEWKSMRMERTISESSLVIDDMEMVNLFFPMEILYTPSSPLFIPHLSLRLSLFIRCLSLFIQDYWLV